MDMRDRYHEIAVIKMTLKSLDCIIKAFFRLMVITNANKKLTQALIKKMKEN